MKRRRTSSLNRPRFPTRAGTAGGNRSSEDHFVPETCRGEQETACRKRLKFVGSNEEDPSSSREGGCYSNEVEPTTRRSEQPKTAEFAFFQKLKEGGAHRLHSHLLHVDKSQHEKFQTHESHKESYAVHTKAKDSSSSMLTENDLPRKLKPFVSPVDTSLKKSDLMPAFTASPKVPVKQKSKAECSNASDMRGADRTRTSDVFSQKRENLRHWLRRSSFPEIEKLSSEGRDFVPLLLSRLSGKSSEDNNFRTPAVDQIRTADTKRMSFNFDSDIYIQELDQKPKKELTEVGVGPFWGYSSSSSWPSKSKERIPVVYDSPSAHGTVPWSEMKTPGYTSLEHNRDLVPQGTSSAVDFPVEEHGTVPFRCLRNMEDFPRLNSGGPFLRRESHAPLLQWNFDKDERDWLAIRPREEVANDHSLSLDFWGNNHRRSVREGFGTSRLPVLPRHESSSIETHLNSGIEEDLAACLTHIPAVYDTPSAHGTVPWSEMRISGYASLEHNKDLVPYTKSDSTVDFPIEEDDTVSFSFLRNMKDFPRSNSGGPFLKRESHTPLLRWNFDKGRRDWLAICPREEMTEDHSRLLNCSIGEGFDGRRLPALPLHDSSSIETHLNMGIEEDLAACLPCLPEDWVHEHSSKLLSLQRRLNEYGDNYLTERQHLQFGREDSASHSGFGSESRCNFLLPWDPSGETKLVLDQTLQFPPVEKFISSLLQRPKSWEDFAERCFRRDSSARLNQSIDRSYSNFHSSFRRDAYDHLY